MKVVKIGADWCSGCIVMKPRWKEIEEQNPWLKTQYFDFDNDQGQIEKYEVKDKRLPSFIFLDKNEQEILRLHGEIEKEELLSLILKHRDK